jgi:signal transduction histidine kinase
VDKKPTFFWQGLLILLPLALLVAFGIYSVQQDRKLVDVEVGERLQRMAQDFARPIEAHLHEQLRHVHPEAHLLINNKGELVSIAGSTNRIHVAELRPGSLQVEKLTPKLASLWEQARTAEFTSAAPATVIDAYQKFVDAHPPDDFLAMANYSVALQWVRSKSTSQEPDRIFRDLEKNKIATTDTGLPLHLLAAMQRLDLNAQSQRPEAFTNLLVEVCSNAVDQPSVITPMILNRAAELEDAFHFAQLNTNSHVSISSLWRDEWQREETARELYATITPAPHRYPDAVWVDWGGYKDDPCLVVIRPEVEDAQAAGARTQEKRVKLKATGNYDVQWLTAAQLHEAIRELESDAGVAVPDYASIAYEVAGSAIGGTRLPGLKEVPYKTSTADGLLEFVVFARVARPDVLYAHQRQRTLLFAALIALAACAACVGLVTARRSFHQQLRLNEMKSNFVSSVSHELRAPIASVRLLAEALDRGAVSEQPKQKEYFRFIVQECRRLTGLIENVLDFSRIEQNRKQYRFEETDLTALVEQTVKLMQPTAAERGLSIESRIADVGLHIVCDGLALQQALVNLIDNALKHSPSGERVIVSLFSMRDSICLSVEDHGSGIPPEDHQKIFERFYRRGSELRRETQGIGIGLTIVKHVAEAHGGRVLVESAVSTGSKFTIELPSKPSAQVSED